MWHAALLPPMSIHVDQLRTCSLTWKRLVTHPESDEAVAYAACLCTPHDMRHVIHMYLTSCGGVHDPL